MLRLVSISDTHGLHRKMTSPIPDGDILIHAGDLSNVGSLVGIEDFADWFSCFPHPHKISIGGNHDGGLNNFNRIAAERALTSHGITYLRDSEYVIDGIKFYGSPWTPKFMSWSFMLYTEKEAKEVWSKIPPDVNVLITHGPPDGILDFSQEDQIHVGCKELKKRIELLPNLKCHVYGHLHEEYGIIPSVCKDWLPSTLDKITFINASTCNLKYEPINKPIIFDYI